MALTPQTWRSFTATMAATAAVSLTAGVTPAVAAPADDVSQLIQQLSKVDNDLDQLQLTIGGLRESANQARLDVEAAQARSDESRQRLEQIHQALVAAENALTAAQNVINGLSQATYRSGGTSNPFLGANSQKDALDRSSFTRQQADKNQQIINDLQKKRDDLAKQQGSQKQATDDADKKAADAKAAQDNAQKKIQNAATQVHEKKKEQDDLTKKREDAAKKLEDKKVPVPQSNNTTPAKPADPAKPGDQGKPATPATPAKPAAPAPSAPAGASRDAKVETVINRAKSQLGMPYAWGGGDNNGPTKGIHDGGVADSYGDYNKIGFDCSGLVKYAYAGVGIDLPHYTGYQYQRGTKIDPKQMQRGDLIFYGPNAEYHVAIYLGNGQMIEAPESGDVVKISPVRWGGMSPYAVRML